MASPYLCTVAVAAFAAPFHQTVAAAAYHQIAVRFVASAYHQIVVHSVASSYRTASFSIAVVVAAADVVCGLLVVDVWTQTLL